LYASFSRGRRKDEFAKEQRQSEKIAVAARLHHLRESLFVSFFEQQVHNSEKKLIWQGRARVGFVKRDFGLWFRPRRVSGPDAKIKRAHRH